jgi:fumarylacetoacetate (FAA) hydrolase
VRLVTFEYQNEVRPGYLTQGRVAPLPYPDMRAVITAADSGSGVAGLEGGTPIALARIGLRAPLQPTSLRDFYAFEEHVRAANANRGRPVPPAWYAYPVFYFSNHQAIFGPGDDIPYPAYTQELDYEMEIAVVIGKPGINIAPEDAPAHIFGYTIMNDWSARDVQRGETSVGLGPAKGKDFATSLGPYIVTPDELAGRETGRPGVYHLPMITRINGVERGRGNFDAIYFDFGQIIARASAGVWLYPGDVLGSGTVGGGCLLELTRAQGPYLQPEDEVELEVEGLGVLRNRITGPGNRI